MYEFALSDPDGVLVRVGWPSRLMARRRTAISSVRGVPYPNYEGKHAHPALTEPAAFVRYWVSHGVLPADHRAPHSVVMLYQRSVYDAVRASGVSPFAPRGRRNTAFLDLHLFDATEVRSASSAASASARRRPSPRWSRWPRSACATSSGSARPGRCASGLDTGDVVVCDRAVRDEGVSHHYLPPARFAEAAPGLTARLHDAFAAAGLDPTIGSAWTIDAPFRETVLEARHYADEGVAVVEMEAAALFAVGAVRGVEVASAFAISDSLADGEWVPQFGDPRLGVRLAAMVDGHGRPPRRAADELAEHGPGEQAAGVVVEPGRDPADDDLVACRSVAHADPPAHDGAHPHQPGRDEEDRPEHDGRHGPGGDAEARRARRRTRPA